MINNTAANSSMLEIAVNAAADGRVDVRLYVGNAVARLARRPANREDYQTCCRRFQPGAPLLAFAAKARRLQLRTAHVPNSRAAISTRLR